MNTIDKSNKYVADNGTEYTLEYDGLFRWVRNGATAEKLKGGFLAKREAIAQLTRYNASLAQEITTPVGELASLEKKAELLGYALREGIEIPEKYKSVGAIKKFLQGGYK